MQELNRRHFIASGLALPGTAAWAAADSDAEALLRPGGVVLALRHALAPGTFDPPQFRLGDCGTQRNLSDEGRAQARRIGQWFKARGLQPARVRSSPWCRCVDTATLAFGAAEPWAALGSPRGATEATNAESLAALRRALVQAGTQRGRFEVWVTHMFVLADLVGTSTGSGEGLVLKADTAGAVQMLGRLAAA
jgi:phosphohistidine phosphatase SixA